MRRADYSRAADRSPPDPYGRYEARRERRRQRKSTTGLDDWRLAELRKEQVQRDAEALDALLRQPMPAPIRRKT